MTAALRDRRIRVYAYTDADNGATGIVDSQYVFAHEYWAEVRAASASERTENAASEHQTTHVISFAFGAVVPVEGVLKDRTSGAIYKVTGMMTRRRADMQQVLASATNTQQFSLNDP